MEKVDSNLQKKKFYVTTAIDYPNAEPHIGHAYQKIIADIIARGQTLFGKDVFFLTGTDEHGKKIQEAAESLGENPKDFVNKMSKKFESAWKSLNIRPNRFIRTTDEDHKKLVQEIIKKCHANGDIYKGTYEGYYCVGCEGYLTEKDLVEGCCPYHNKPLELLKEESYFFRLSKYQEFLLNYYEKHPEFILPVERRNEIINRVKEGLRDLSISRKSFSWGIPFPLDKKHIVYVWFDALFNYLSGIGEEEYWPADIHLLGKDNSWFHTVYWPAFLKSAGYELPKTVFVHGFLSFNGKKISKSLGNTISPNVLVTKYGTDALRYFCARQFPFAEGNDGDFSEKSLIERHNNELANKLGNLVSRVSALAEKYGTEKSEDYLIKKINIELIKKKFNSYQFDKVLSEIFSFIDSCNEYVQKKEIWKTGDKKALYELVDSIKLITILLYPFIPETTERISNHFNFQINLENLEKKLDYKDIKKAPVLFSKIEYKKEKINKEEEFKEIEGVSNMAELIKYNDFTKLDLRVGTIKAAEDIIGADKLFKLTVDLGNNLGERIILAGIKNYYTKEELKNKQIVVIINLEPRKMKGMESQGMLLAAGGIDSNICVLVSPEKKVDNGTKLS